MINEDRVIIKNDIDIGATIAYKDKNKKSPLVVLVAGTGSLDRDGNTLGFKLNIYKKLSDMFVDMGFVCIRYDKRATHESTGKIKDMTLNNLVNDVANIIHYGKKLEYVDEEKIVVCGHSEGAMIATLLTKQEPLKGIILLGGACMGLKEAMLYQNYLVIEHVKDMKGILGWYLRKTLKKEQIETKVSKIFEKAEQSKKDVYFYGGSLVPTKYMKEHHELTSEEYIKILKEYKGQILAITGKLDVQADYRALEQISSLSNATIYTPDNINHLLVEASSEENILTVKKEYKKTFKKDIDHGIKGNIKEWTKKLN